MVYSQFAQSRHFAHSHFARIFPRFAHFFSPFPASPFSNSGQCLSCPFVVLPNFIFAHFSFRPEAISPKVPILPNDHFALFQQGPIPFRPNAVFLMSGPKTNKKFCKKLIPQFWTLFLRLLWTAHIIGEVDILVTLCFFYQCGYSYDDAYFGSF